MESNTIVKRGRGRPRKLVNVLSPNISGKQKVSLSADLKGPKERIKTKSGTVEQLNKVRSNTKGVLTNLRRSPRLEYLRTAVT